MVSVRPGVKWREVRNVVEDTTQDVIVGQLEQRWSAVDQKRTCDVGTNIVVVPCIVCTKCEAGCEHQCAERL